MQVSQTCRFVMEEGSPLVLSQSWARRLTTSLRLQLSTLPKDKAPIH
jgi:hypothetical protein